MTMTAENRWLEIRALYEGGAANCERLAFVSGLTAKRIERRSVQEGWTSPEDGDAARFGRIRGLQEIALAEVDASMKARQGKGFDKTRMETAASALKIVEKLLDTERASTLARQQAERARLAERDEAERARSGAAHKQEDAENARKEQEERDAEIARILESIEKQIDLIARSYACELAGHSQGRKEGGAGRG